VICDIRKNEYSIMVTGKRSRDKSNSVALRVVLKLGEVREDLYRTQLKSAVADRFRFQFRLNQSITNVLGLQFKYVIEVWFKSSIFRQGI
jgi:hypothetical protein